MRFVLFLISLVVAVPAWAATYYVRSDGSNANPGTANSAMGAWRKISKFNVQGKAGDTLVVCSLLPADTVAGAIDTCNIIRPSRSGNQYADDMNNTSGIGPIVYIGLEATPEILPVRSITLDCKKWIIVKGFRAQNGVSFSSTTSPSCLTERCVVSHCHIGATIGFKGAQHCRLSHSNTLLSFNNSSRPIFWRGGDDEFLAPFPYRDTLRQVAIRYDQPADRDDYHMLMMGFTNNCLIDSSRFYMFCKSTVATGGNPHFWAIEESFSNTYRDNFFQMDGALGPSVVMRFAVRSGTRLNMWERDTFYCGLNSPTGLGAELNLTQHAGPRPQWTNYPGSPTDQAHSNTWLRCLIKGDRGWKIQAQNTLDRSNIERCTFVSDSAYALSFLDGFTSSVVKYNLFYNTNGPAIFSELFDTAPTPGSYRTAFLNNIFLAGFTSGSSCATGVIRLEDNSMYQPGLWNKNCYFTLSGSPDAVYSQPNPTGCFTVGPSGTYLAVNNENREGFGVYGDPKLANTTFAGFNGTLLDGTAAVGGDFCGNPPSAEDFQVEWNLGGYCFAGPNIPTDLVSPSVPYNLSATSYYEDSKLMKRIQFAITGDDSTFGQADSLFYAEKPYDGTGFNASEFWSYVLSRQDNPGQRSGNLMTYTCEVPGDATPECGTDAIDFGCNCFGYAMVAVKDEAGNTSYSMSTIIPGPP